MMREYMAEATQCDNTMTGVDAVEQIGNSFNRAINFLGNFERFRDPITNIITTSGSKIIGAQCVQAGVIEQLDVPTLSFVTVGGPLTPQAYVALPHRFHEMTANDPVLQLGAVAQILERVRLFTQGHMRTPNDEFANARANAVEAGVAAGLSAMLDAEDIDYKFTPEHTLQRLDYPEGVRSLGYDMFANGIAPQRADHIKPTSAPEPRQVSAVGEVDAMGCLSIGIAQVSAMIARLQQRGVVTSYKDLEYYLRQAASPVFLHAYPANHYGDQFEPRDLLTNEPAEFGLGITVTVGAGESLALTKSFGELNETYEENVEKLDHTGVFALNS